MGGPGVTIVDCVTLPSGDAMAWLDRLRSDYAPAAEHRGMRLAAAWWSHVGPDAVEVTVRWDLADVPAFWAMRRAAGQDHAVREWWASTDALASARRRNVCAGA